MWAKSEIGDGVCSVADLLRVLSAQFSVLNLQSTYELSVGGAIWCGQVATIGPQIKVHALFHSGCLL